MKLIPLPQALTVCKLPDQQEYDPKGGFYFLARTANELSLVCPTETAPAGTIAREDSWRAFYIEGTLDFSLIGILAKISAILAENAIGIFVVSTYDTDYILVKAENFARALAVLGEAGYEIRA